MDRDDAPVAEGAVAFGWEEEVPGEGDPLGDEAHVCTSPRGAQSSSTAENTTPAAVAAAASAAATAATEGDSEAASAGTEEAAA
eukprot:357606-Chlamydomonas_euryale.AAC.8